MAFLSVFSRLAHAALLIVCAGLGFCGPSLARDSRLALLVIEKSENHCQFRFHFPKQNSTQDWFTLSACADFSNILYGDEPFIFDMPHRQAIFIQNKEYFIVPLQRGAKPRHFATVPSFVRQERITLFQAWLDQKSGFVRAAFLVPYPFNKDAATGTDIQRAFPMLETTLLDYKAKGRVLESVVFILDCTREGQWTQVAALPIVADSYTNDIFEIDSVVAFMNKEAHSISVTDMVGTSLCEKQKCYDPPFALSKPYPKGVADKMAANDPAYEANYVALDQHQGFLTFIFEGDSYHWAKPIYYCTGSKDNICATHQEIPVQADTISIGVRHPYVLLADEQGAFAQLFKIGAPRVDRKSVRPILRYGANTLVAWMPQAPW